MNTKVRFVRCPKCLLVLPEFTEIPVYTCGGCKTVLQAKHRKHDMNEAGHDHETDEHGIKEADCVSRIIHSTKDADVSPIEESSAPSTSRNDDNIDNMNMKETQERDFFQEVPLSPGRHFTEYEDSSLEQRKQMEQDNDNSALNPNTGTDDFPISMELTSHEMEDSSIELHQILGTEEDTYDTDQCTEAAEIRRGKGKMEYFEGSNMSDDVSSVMLDSSPESGTHEQRSKSDLLSQQDSAGSSFAFFGPEVGKELNDWKLESFKREGILDSKESDPVDDSKSLSDENISVNIVISPDNQHLEPPWKSYPQDFKHASDADSSTHLPLAGSICELHAMSPDFVRFPTRSYYACDASVSSYDGMDDQVPTRSSKPPRRKLKPPPSITSEEGLLNSETEMHYQGYNRSGANDPMSSESEVQHFSRKATFLEANHGVNRTRPQNKDYMQRLPRDLLARQIEDGPPPTYYQRRYSSFISQDTPLHNEPDKVELLKMITELKDELNRTRISNSSFPARFSGEERHTGSNAGGNYADFLHSSNPTSCSQMKGLPQGPRISRMAFSGEASDYSLRGNCTYLHCFRQGHNYSDDLSLHGMYSNEAHRLAAHNGHTFYKGSCSASSSRQLHTGFQFLQEHQTMSDDRRHRESENGRQFVTKRNLSSKRYIRPAAGGIPILSCYHCYELLLLPADFLLSGRKCHQLRCNACKKIMKFSLKSRKHLVPCVPDVVAPPPSVVNDYNDSSSLSHPNIDSNGGPVSFSDEYGMSIDRSCSIKSEHLARMPHDTLKHGNLNNRVLAAAAFKPYNDQKVKFGMRESHARHKNSVETIGSTGKGKLKELPPRLGSTLHMLMGYSSPSRVIRR